MGYGLLVISVHDDDDDNMMMMVFLIFFGIDITIIVKHSILKLTFDLYYTGASAGSVDLLPNPAVSSWTRSLPTDDGLESDQIFSFDGSTNAIEIPSTKFNHTLEEHFTISTWMKHEHDSDEGMPEKQHILCNSDGEREYY